MIGHNQAMALHRRVGNACLQEDPQEEEEEEEAGEDLQDSCGRSRAQEATLMRLETCTA